MRVTNFAVKDSNLRKEISEAADFLIFFFSEWVELAAGFQTQPSPDSVLGKQMQAAYKYYLAFKNMLPFVVVLIKECVLITLPL